MNVVEDPVKESARRNPCHRKCVLCIFYDDDWDPVDLAQGRKVYMMWGKPCNSKGETMGQFCYYCVKVFCALFRSVPGMTLSNYQKSLDDVKLKLHVNMVNCVVKKITESGGNRRAVMDWDTVEDCMHW